MAGTLLLNGQIPGQYDQAKAQIPAIKTIIMTGGDNDVMFSGGCDTKEACTAFTKMIADGLDALWKKAAADGVTSAVYIQYSRNAGTAPADTRPDMTAVPTICADGEFRCVFINTTDLIAATDTPWTGSIPCWMVAIASRSARKKIWKRLAFVANRSPMIKP